MRRLGVIAALLALAACQVRAADFKDWAVVVVSGDDHAAHAQTHTEAFDNARHDIVRLLEQRGFAAQNIAEFSVQAAREHVPATEPSAILDRLGALAAHAPGGCLFYVSSHGAPGRIVMGESEITPRQLAAGLKAACGERPTIVVLSACFSGSFVPALKGANRFVLTAARKDRSSFGCGESDRYPYFDACIIEALPNAPDFASVADRARTCVAEREDEEGLRPRSEPQLSIGKDVQGGALAFMPISGTRS